MMELKLNNSTRTVPMDDDYYPFAADAAREPRGPLPFQDARRNFTRQLWAIAELRNPFDRSERLMNVSEPDNPEVLAVALLPSAEERKRRERVLVRLLLITLEMLLSEGHTDLAVKIETAKDVIREFKHVYPETMNI